MSLIENMETMLAAKPDDMTDAEARLRISCTSISMLCKALILMEENNEEINIIGIVGGLVTTCVWMSMNLESLDV